jgi:hypothetical protein
MGLSAHMMGQGILFTPLMVNRYMIFAACLSLLKKWKLSILMLHIDEPLLRVLIK